MPPDRDGLADDQAQIIEILRCGPEAYRDGLFAGSRQRVLLGLKAHANTISHARLVALEETFPRTLERLGATRFNALSRDFVELPATRQRKLMAIGSGFAEFLADQGCDAASVDLARIEGAWLESYHAVDARALAMADLAGLDEPGLLSMPIVLHPACRSVATTAPLARELGELADARATAAAVLITRREASVHLLALDADQAAVLAHLEKSHDMRNLLSAAVETGDEAKVLPAIFVLIEAGVLADPNV